MGPGKWRYRVGSPPALPAAHHRGRGWEPFQGSHLSSLTITLLGAAAALVFGRVVARMPLGAPLVMLGLGGLGFGLTALALYRVLDPLLRLQATTSAEHRALIEEELRARLAAGTETTE